MNAADLIVNIAILVVALLSTQGKDSCWIVTLVS
jgi:hypothetical protein